MSRRPTAELDDYTRRARRRERWTSAVYGAGRSAVSAAGCLVELAIISAIVVAVGAAVLTAAGFAPW